MVVVCCGGGGGLLWLVVVEWRLHVHYNSGVCTLGLEETERARQISM